MEGGAYLMKNRRFDGHAAAPRPARLIYTLFQAPIR